MQNQRMQRLTPTKFSYQNENINNMNTKKTPKTPKKLNCMNHPAKRAKYCMPKDLSVSLCSKCAVSMVGKGFKVEELQGYEEDFRKEQITKFLQQINAQIPSIERIQTAVMAKREDISKYYEQQKDKVNRFHQQLKENLDSEKEKIILQLTTNYRTISKVYDDAIVNLNNSKLETLGMQKDIEQNLERIIKNISIEPFNEIMESYSKNLATFTSKIEEIHRKPIEVLKLLDSLPTVNYFTVGTLKTSLIKKSLQDLSLRTMTNESIYVSFENKEQFTQPRLPKQGFPLAKTPKPSSVPIKNIDLYEIQPTEEEEYEEGHSQMIERDDIENSYQMMMYEGSSDNEDMSSQLELIQTINACGNNNNNNKNSCGIKLFCSPQFKDH